MESKFAKKAVSTWSLSKLRSHPCQRVFRPHTTAEIRSLADSLDREGLISPVEIMPDGTIICGYGRVTAARLLGWPTIHVWIRHDLLAQGDDAVRRRLIEDNLNRRQLTKLGLGRAFLALKQQLYEAWQEAGGGQAQGDFRDHLGELLGCDGTTAERWARLAVLPAEYDLLIEMGLLTQQQAEKIVKCLPADIRETLGRKLATISATNVPRRDKKRQVNKAVAARVGNAGKCSARQTTWFDKLNSAVHAAINELPAPISSFAAELDRRNAVTSMLNLIRRKFPEQVEGVHIAREQMDEFDADPVRHTVLTLLGLLQAAEACGNGAAAD